MTKAHGILWEGADHAPSGHRLRAGMTRLKRYLRPRDRLGIVIMGGGVRPDGTLPPWAKLRVDAAAAAAHHCTAPEPLIFCSSCFTLNRLPPPSGDRLLSDASALANEYRRQSGVGTVICEQQSHDTVGSAVFLSLLYFRPFRVRRVAVVSSDWHAPRCLTVFAKIAALSPWIDQVLVVGAVGGGSKVARAARVKSERKSERLFTETFGHCTSMDDMLKTLVREHSNYNEAFASRHIQSALF